MRQAASTIIVCVCVVYRIGGSRKRPCERRGRYDRAGARLLDAKDYASAATLLEDLLLESGAKERTEILGMLKQSYEVLARRGRGRGPRARSSRLPRQPRDTWGELSRRASRSARQPACQAAANNQRSPAVSHDEPTQPPENRPRPAGPTVLAPSASPAASAPAAERTGGTVRARRDVPIPIRPHGELRSRRPSRPAGAERIAGRARASTKPIDSFRRKSTTKPADATRSLAREQRLPSNRTNHWAYCRIVGVATTDERTAQDVDRMG